MTKILRGLVVAITFAFLMLFTFQNYDVLSQDLSLRLNLYLYEVRTMPVATGVLLILFFLVGFAMSSLYGIYDRFLLRMTIRRQASAIDRLSSQIPDKAKDALPPA